MMVRSLELKIIMLFVNLFDGTDGFLHISDYAYERTKKMGEVVKLGDIIKVKSY